MTFAEIRADIRTLQFIAFTFLALWGVSGNALFLAGFPLLFALLGFSIASFAREARTQNETINPLRQIFDFAWSWFLHIHLVILAIVVWILFQPGSTKDAWLSSGFPMSSGLGNWWQISRPENYFGFDSQTSPFIHLWVMSAFAQLAVLLIILFYVVSQFRFHSRAIFGRIGLSVLFGLFGYLLYNFHINVSLTSQYFLSTWSWFWALLFGCTVAFMKVRLPESHLSSYLSDAVFLIVCGLLLAGYFDVTFIRGYFMYLPLVLVLTLVLASRNETLIYRLLTSTPLSILARLSFGAFLWHWPLTQFMKRSQGVEALSPTLALLTLMFSFGLSFLSTWLIDNLSNRIDNIGGLRRWTTKVSLLAIVPLAVFFLQSPVTQNVNPNPTPTTVFTPALDAIESDVPEYIDDPNCSQGSTTCIFGDKKSKVHLVLFGNDLAGNWQPALAKVAVEKGWKLEVRIHPKCPLAEANKTCDKWREQTKNYLLQVKPDLVLTNFNIVNNTNSRTGPQGQAPEILNSDVVIFEDLIKKNIKVVLLRGATTIPANPVQCLKSSNDYLQECLFPRSDGYLSGQDLERRLVFMPTGVEIIDVTDLFCSQDVCFIANPNAEVIYRTSTLITKTFSLTLADALIADIEDILSNPISTRPFNCRENDRRKECELASSNQPNSTLKPPSN